MPSLRRRCVDRAGVGHLRRPDHLHREPTAARAQPGGGEAVAQAAHQRGEAAAKQVAALALSSRARAAACNAATEGGLQCTRVMLRASKSRTSFRAPESAAIGAPNAFASEQSRATIRSADAVLTQGAAAAGARQPERLGVVEHQQAAALADTLQVGAHRRGPEARRVSVGHHRRPRRRGAQRRGAGRRRRGGERRDPRAAGGRELHPEPPDRVRPVVEKDHREGARRAPRRGPRRCAASMAPASRPRSPEGRQSPRHRARCRGGAERRRDAGRQRSPGRRRPAGVLHVQVQRRREVEHGTASLVSCRRACCSPGSSEASPCSSSILRTRRRPWPSSERCARSRRRCWTSRRWRWKAGCM